MRNTCVCRVYDNALANAVMQQAAIILQIEESMPCLRRCYDNEHIHRHCTPLGEFFDDDVTTNPDQHAEMKKLTEQIKVSALTTTGCCIFTCLFLNLRITETLHVLQDTLDKYLNIQREAISPQLAYADARDVTRLVNEHLGTYWA